ncbi:MAG: SpoIVB peptidase [Acutalibacteraceae bacterium]|nr:SpoIVB peptidase [Acutalibacteraceae bacterium]
MIVLKFARVLTKSLFYIFLALDIVIFSMIAYLDMTVTDDYKIKKGDPLTFDTAVPITAVYEGTKLSASKKSDSIGEEFNVDLKAFGIIPFSTVSVEVVDELRVAVLGTPFGMKLYTDGVLVIDMTDVETENGNVNPAKEAGIKKGDYIVSVDGREITTNEELGAAVEASAGNEMKFEIKRNGKTKIIRFCAALSKETNSYKIGLWVRDSSAGIGTLTFYSPATGVVCGLGHGVCDEDTEELLKLDSGELVTAEIVSVQKGSSGSPGELKGKFTYSTIGAIDLNSECGVFSLLQGRLNLSNLTEIALKQEVRDGEAQLLCTVNGELPKLFSCSIKKKSSAYLSPTKNLVVTVTDEELLNLTGGIVQGMSGSPILQNGKLIGAVTHVLIDDPTRGYGIFAENMLKTAQTVEEQSLKKAS